jgi:hypothetical protein
MRSTLGLRGLNCRKPTRSPKSRGFRSARGEHSCKKNDRGDFKSRNLRAKRCDQQSQCERRNDSRDICYGILASGPDFHGFRWCTRIARRFPLARPSRELPISKPMAIPVWAVRIAAIRDTPMAERYWADKPSQGRGQNQGSKARALQTTCR